MSKKAKIGLISLFILITAALSLPMLTGMWIEKNLPQIANQMNDGITTEHQLLFKSISFPEPRITITDFHRGYLKSTATVTITIAKSDPKNGALNIPIIIHHGPILSVPSKDTHHYQIGAALIQATLTKVTPALPFYFVLGYNHTLTSLSNSPTFSLQNGNETAIFNQFNLYAHKSPLLHAFKTELNSLKVIDPDSDNSIVVTDTLLDTQLQRDSLNHLFTGHMKFNIENIAIDALNASLKKLSLSAKTTSSADNGKTASRFISTLSVGFDKLSTPQLTLGPIHSGIRIEMEKNTIERFANNPEHRQIIESGQLAQHPEILKQLTEDVVKSGMSVHFYANAHQLNRQLIDCKVAATLEPGGNINNPISLLSKFRFKTTLSVHNEYLPQLISLANKKLDPIQINNLIKAMKDQHIVVMDGDNTATEIAFINAKLLINHTTPDFPKLDAAIQNVLAPKVTENTPKPTVSKPITTQPKHLQKTPGPHQKHRNTKSQQLTTP